jgi:hypothetical protein
MSEHGFHVHGPHDHELEHAAHSSPDSFAGRLAVATAILATIGAIFSYMGGATQANAGLFKNDAAIKKTEAANQWAYYQSKSGKQNLSELAIEVVPDAKKAFYQDEVKRYKAEKDAIKAKAEGLDAESIAYDEKSNAQLHEHHRWAQATTVLQISIAMAAIALLTKRRWLVWGVAGLGVGGTLLGVLAWLHV